MRLRSSIIAAVCLSIATLAAIVAAAFKSAAPVEISVTSVAELGTARLVALAFRRCNPRAYLVETNRLQLRVAGVWQPAMRLPELSDGYLFARTNCERVVFSFPAEAEACRFSLGYRVGPSLYCRAYSFLHRHGLSQKFPNFSRLVLNCFSQQQPRLRRVECELMIQTATQNQSAGANSRRAVPFRVADDSSLAPALHRRSSASVVGR